MQDQVEIQQILTVKLSVWNVFKDDVRGTRRTETANITKDDITSQHSDILAMCCEVISSFVTFALLVLRVSLHDVVLKRRFKLIVYTNSVRRGFLWQTNESTAKIGAIMSLK